MQIQVCNHTVPQVFDYCASLIVCELLGCAPDNVDILLDIELVC